MSKYRFSLSGLETRREGVVESDSFAGAVDTLSHHVSVRRGDVLEIGVFGFPPAKFECVGQIESGSPVWMPAGQLAA